MPFFHALSGTDSTSAFYKKSKSHLFNKWMNSPFESEITTAFQRLSWCPSEVTIKDCLPVINKFIVWVYGGKDVSLNKFRLSLFKASSINNLRELPPSENGLELHVRRSQYQAGHVLGNSTSQLTTPPVDVSGWKLQNGTLLIDWTTSNISHELLNKLIKTCKCQANTDNEKYKSCTCSTLELQCLDQCKCSRKCSNRS